MEGQQLITDIFVRIAQGLERVLDGLTVDDLNQRPGADCNSIGWLAWHLTRCQDREIGEVMGEEQLWIKGGWHARFNRAAEPADTGFGHSSADVAAFRSPDGKTLLAYHRAVLERSKDYIGSKLSVAELATESESPTVATIDTVGACLVGVISGNLQHVGQAAYVRGLLKGKGWLGV